MIVLPFFDLSVILLLSVLEEALVDILSESLVVPFAVFGLVVSVPVFGCVYRFPEVDVGALSDGLVTSSVDGLGSTKGVVNGIPLIRISNLLLGIPFPLLEKANTRTPYFMPGNKFSSVTSSQSLAQFFISQCFDERGL
jgi:hypothetical protein